jgi:DNA-binding transcriptional LysR family regulator
LSISFKYFEYKNRYMSLNTSHLLTPEALQMLQAVAEHGSLAGAARALGVVPSALTYRVRQLEDGLDVLLFDRSSRKALLTDAGRELISEGRRILADLDAVAHRVKRVATGWEPQLTIAIDSIIAQRTVMELTEAFFALQPPTQLKLQRETLSGTLEALLQGQADLALGVVVDQSSASGVRSKPLGEVPFVFAVAPHHPLASATAPLSDTLIAQHRAVAVADSTRSGRSVSLGLLAGQRVLTVSDMQAKLDAQLRGLGCGFLPQCLAQPHIDTGRLVAQRTERAQRVPKVSYAWRSGTGKAGAGKALTWWLAQLDSATTRHALLYGHGHALLTVG